MNRHLKDSIMYHALRNMRYTLFILGCLLCTLPAHAVLKEKNLAHTLGVLKAELKADYEKQQVFMENYEMQSQAQHRQLVSYMQKCEQIGLMLYSQKADYTFDMAYACQEATELYMNLSKNNKPYDRIMAHMEQEVERYTELIRSLKKLPPIAEKDKKELMTGADSLIAEAMDSLRLAEKEAARLAAQTEEDTTSLEAEMAEQMSQIQPEPEDDGMVEEQEPYLLNEEQQADREECLTYAQSMKDNLEAFLASLTNERAYYTSVSEKASELNDFAQSRYHIMQNSIFKNGGSNYFRILAGLPMNIKRAMSDVHSKYSTFEQHQEGYSEWRGMYMMFISVFIFVYMGIAALISTVIIRLLTPKRFRTEQFKQKRNMLNAALGIFIFAVCVMVARTFIDRNFVLMGTSLMILLAWLLLVIFTSFLIRLNGEQVKHAVRIYLPFICMALIVILFRIILIPNSLVNLIYPPILLVFTIWQVHTIRKDRSALPASDVMYSNVSAVAMVVACAASWIGYTLLAVEIMVWWMFQLAAIQTITCLYDLMQSYENKKLVYSLDPELKARKEAGEDVSKEVQALLLRMKDGDFITKTWFYDLMRLAVIPILIVWSFLFSIFKAADIFEMTSICINIFRYKFIDQENLIQLSLAQICVVMMLFCLFRYINYLVPSLYRHLRKNVIKTEGTYNRTLANNIIGVLVWGLFFIIVLNLLKIPSSGISLVTAGLATGLGFAMKDLIENFIYGISLMTGRVHVGDYIECDGIQGKVESITYQSTQLVTADGCVIAFLNSALFNKNFKNMTRNHRYELIKIPVGVAYGSDIEQVRRIIIEAITPACKVRTASGQRITDERQSIAVSFVNFGDNSVDLCVCVWMLVEEKIGLTGRIKELIYNALNENNIEIPFPQRDIHIRND